MIYNNEQKNKLDHAEKGISKEMIINSQNLDKPQKNDNTNSQTKIQTSNNIICFNQLNIGIAGTFKSIIFGRRASGRSTIVKQLLRCCNDSVGQLHQSYILIFHGIENICPVYNEKVPSNAEIHAQYDPTILSTFLSKHTSDIGNAAITIVFDKCFDMGSTKDTQLDELMTLPINLIFVIDHPMTLPYSIRYRCNFLFLFKENVYAIRKRIYDCNYWKLESIFSSMEIYDRMYASATEVAYGYVLIDISKRTCYVGRALSVVNCKEFDLYRTKSNKHYVAYNITLDAIMEEQNEIC
jgi:hypothetical protein